MCWTRLRLSPNGGYGSAHHGPAGCSALWGWGGEGGGDVDARKHQIAEVLKTTLIPAAIPSGY